MVDESHGFAAESVGQVGGLVDALGATHDFVVATPAFAEVRMGAAEEAEELIEPAFGRPQSFLGAQMPFADHSGRIAGRLQPFGESFFVADEAEVVRGFVDGSRVELVAEALLIAARHQAGPGRAADRAGNVARGESDAVLGERINVGSRDVLVPLATELSI